MMIRAFLLLSLAAPGIVDAKPREAQRRAPPQVAVDACAALTESAECSFSGRYDETVNGTCAAPPRGEELTLACMPIDGPPHRRRSPPPADPHE